MNRPCIIDGCWELTAGTYCSAHRPRQRSDRHRRSQAERGYNAEYRRNRMIVLRRDGWT